MLALIVLFVVVPLVELYVLAQVSHAIGLLPALITLLVVSIGGAALVKRQGLGVLRNMRRSLDDRQLPTEHLADGALVLLSGALLVVPGFVTDAVGAVLLVPPVRRRLARYVRDRYARRGRLTATYAGRVVDGTVVDRTVVTGTVVTGTGVTGSGVSTRRAIETHTVDAGAASGPDRMPPDASGDTDSRSR